MNQRGGREAELKEMISAKDRVAGHVMLYNCESSSGSSSGQIMNTCLTFCFIAFLSPC